MDTTRGRKAVRFGAAILALGAIAAPGLSTSAWAKGSGSAKLNQCANGPASAPVSCVADQTWVNGNLGPSKSHYGESDSVPYRLVMSGMAPGATVHTVVLQWDTTDKGKHALDYLTSYDRTVAADPCAGVAGCGSPSTFPIPADPHAVNPLAGSFTIFGGSITGASAYAQSGSPSANGSTSVTISFTASVADLVLAWGGHIASQADWGAGNSAVSVSGSPYHMRLLSLDGSGGHQDRSLKVAGASTPNPSPSPTPSSTPSSTPTSGSTPSPRPNPGASQSPAPGSSSTPAPVTVVNGSTGQVSVLGAQVSRPAAAPSAGELAPASTSGVPQAPGVPAGELPMTGSNTVPLAVTALLLLAVGGTLCRAGRRPAAE